jgi:hypothetical protein
MNNITENPIKIYLKGLITKNMTNMRIGDNTVAAIMFDVN